MKIKAFIMAVALSVLSMNASEYDMPIVHKVAKGESLYGISKQYGMLVDDLLRLNPSAEDGIKVGEELVIRAPKRRVEAKPVKKVDVAEEDMSVENDPTLSTIKVSDERIEQPAYNIALFMPFMLNEETMSTATRTYLDFYKGFLLAADALKDSGRNINVYAYDTYNSIDSLNLILAQPQIQDMNVVIAPPGNIASVKTIATACDKETTIFNAFYANDTAHFDNNNVIQANVARDVMYDKVISWLVAEYADYTPVIIGSPANKNRVSMAEDIKRKYEERGVEPKEIVFGRNLNLVDLERLDKKTKYLFIPWSSSEKEFDKLVEPLREFKNLNSEEIALFGYPEWITFKDSRRANLHTFNAVIYSRFYFNEDGNKEKDFAQKFLDVYKAPMKKSPPIQAVLGYDCGYYLIKALREGDGKVLDADLKYSGLQYTFDLTDVDGKKGAENKSVYVVRYLIDNEIEEVVL